MQTETARKLPPKVEGIYIHRPNCRCWLCDAPPKSIGYLRTRKPKEEEAGE